MTRGGGGRRGAGRSEPNPFDARVIKADKGAFRTAFFAPITPTLLPTRLGRCEGSWSPFEPLRGVRYYGRYSNKCRGMEVQAWEGDPADQQPATVPPPPAASARNLRPLWRNLILRIWPVTP